MSDPVAASRTLNEWSLVCEGFDPSQEALRESLCTLGNGRFASRGAAPEADADGTHYPGTYAAGCYNRLTSEVAGRQVEDESIVNLPNWLPLRLRIEDGEWLNPSQLELIEYRQELDLRRALLMRQIRFRDGEGRETALTERRFMSMADPNVAALETTVVPVNWSGKVAFRAALDGRVANGGVARYRNLSSHHLVAVDVRAVDPETILLEVETSQSHIRVAEAARTRLLRGDEIVSSGGRVIEDSDRIALEIETEVGQGEAIKAEKVVTLYTSREPAVSAPALEACRGLAAAGGFDELLDQHVLRWDELWDSCSFELEDEDGLLGPQVRFHLYHLLVTISEHINDVDAGLPARGLAGEAYRGHIFWDALFVFPFFTLRLPDLTRALMRYRYRRLGSARWAARAAGYDGAIFPWQGGANGDELTPTVHLNPRSGRWNPDHSHLQRHINIAIAFDIWKYHQATNDTEALALYGAEIFIEISRFWASIATYDPARDRYVINGVVGPDEYHDGYPDSEQHGINNNAYTNAMAAWVLWRAQNVLDALPDQRREQLKRTLGLRVEEIERWGEISRKLLIPIREDGIIDQFEGYGELEELDWDGYREKYGNIERLDRLLEAEGDTVNRYKASKQADVLMLFYLLSFEELRELFGRLGYRFDYDTIPANISYYEARTSHGSTLSKLVYAWVLIRSDRQRAWTFLTSALEGDLLDTQGGTTPEGVHLGAMGGSVDLLQRGFAGIEARDEVLWFDPQLPEELGRLRFNVRYRRHWGLAIEITRDRIRIESRPADVHPIAVGIKGEVVQLGAGTSVERPL